MIKNYFFISTINFINIIIIFISFINVNNEYIFLLFSLV